MTTGVVVITCGALVMTTGVVVMTCGALVMTTGVVTMTSGVNTLVGNTSDGRGVIVAAAICGQPLVKIKKAPTRMTARSVQPNNPSKTQIRLWFVLEGWGAGAGLAC